MRFHACLLGLKYGIKVFALPYDIKVEHLAREFSLQSINVSEKPENYNPKFSDFMQYDNQEKPDMHFNWNVIDSYMSK